jgi:signal transduction histidine kinase
MRSLSLKLALAFLLVSLSGIALVAVLAGQTTASEFGHFMVSQNQDALAAELVGYYRANGSWAGVEALFSLRGMGMGNGPMHGMMMDGEFALADAGGRVIVSGAGHRLGESLTAFELAQGTPLRVDGQLAGTLLAGHGVASTMMTPAGTLFLARVNRALILGAAGAGAGALILGALLTSTLTRPLRELTTAARGIARGRLEQRVAVRSRDELGELANTFNQMSADLARAQDARRQMTADIAHDLRTPLSVILGHAEALRDGVIPPTPENLNLIHAEALRLSRLVEDLRTLSLAEAGELTLARRPTAPRALVEHAVAAHAVRAQSQQITLRAEIEPSLPDVSVDPDRTAQVLGNLLDNALRHTPPGGRVACSVRRDATRPTAHVIFAVCDTGPGISPDDLPRIFDRFYRADKARARTAEGGSGLGLAIARSIVEGHGGTIRAESQPGQGAKFVIELPISAKGS